MRSMPMPQPAVGGNPHSRASQSVARANRPDRVPKAPLTASGPSLSVSLVLRSVRWNEGSETSTEERPWAHCCIRLCCVLRVAWRRRTLRVERRRCILTAENCLLLAEQPPLPTNQHCGAPMRRAVALLRNQSALYYVALHATNQSALYYVASDVLCRDEALPSPAV
jgi:hypothetical protein